MNELINLRKSVFEQIRHIDENGMEYWSAREMAKVLEYSEYRHFLPTRIGYGAGNFRRLKEAIRCSVILTTSFCALWSILIVVFTAPIINYFGKDETMHGIARTALRANTIMFFTFGFQFVYSTLHMAIGRARQSLLLNIGRQGLFFIPAILLLPSYWGLNGVLYAHSLLLMSLQP